MSDKNPKMPQTGGAAKALEGIKKFRNQPPSERLVKIISEYGNDEKPHAERDQDNLPIKPPAAAKDVEI